VGGCHCHWPNIRGRKDSSESNVERKRVIRGILSTSIKQSNNRGCVEEKERTHVKCFDVYAHSAEKLHECRMGEMEASLNARAPKGTGTSADRRKILSPLRGSRELLLTTTAFGRG
jgi:hypothetical protein